MRKVYVAPTLTPRPSPDAKNSTTAALLNSFTPIKPSSYRPESFRQYVAQQNVPKPIRGRELFIRSIRRILENIREKKQRAKQDQQIFATYEEAINIFQELNFMKCVLLKKKLLDLNHQKWTVEFARQGGLHAVLSYLQRASKTSLSLVDAILVNEVLQCLRAMMNIDELFEHIATNPQYIDSIAKVLSVSSAEVRMRVFELLTALCICSRDGYEIVLRALQDFQTQQKLSNIFTVILEQLKYSVAAKHKWSAIALLNTILKATESVEKRISYRHVLHSNGLLQIFEQIRSDADHDLNVQMDIFLENQREDEEQFLGHFDPNDNQAVYQAIQLQFPKNSNESAVLLTTMQTLYSTLTSADAEERSKILQSVLDFISYIRERKLVEKSVQTDPIAQPDTKTTTPVHHILGSLAPIPIEKPTESPLDSGLIKTVTSVNILPAPNQPDSVIVTPPPPFGGSSPLPPPTSGGPPPPPPFGGPPPPPPFGGPPPPPPPGGLPPPPPLGAPLPSTSIAGLSALVDGIPKPKCQVRRLQWKKLPQAILNTSQFWLDVNKNIDSEISFSELEEYFKVNVTASAEKKDVEAPKKKKEPILTSNRSLAINLFQKKFSFTNLQHLVRTIENPDASLGVECFRLLHQALPTREEIDLVHNSSSEDWNPPEQFVHAISLIPYYEFRIRTMLLICDFDETFNDYKQKFGHIIRVINFLQSDPSIKQLARSLLSIGDFLNYGSYAGNAFGFRLDILNQLQSIRLSENGNLLAILLKKTPQNFKFVDDLKPLLADDIQLQPIKTDYQQWRKKIVDGLKEINNIEVEQVITQYQSFYQKSNARILTELDPLMMECESKEKDFMKQFGETDASEFNYEKCCDIFRQLIDQVAKENQERKKALQSTKSLYNSMKSTDESTAVSIGKLDSLMSDLKKNKFATAPTRRVRRRPDLFENMDREIK